MDINRRLNELGIARTDRHRFAQDNGRGRAAAQKVDLLNTITGTLHYPSRGRTRLDSTCHFIVARFPISTLIVVENSTKGDSVTGRIALIATLLYQRWAFQLARIPLVIEHEPDNTGYELWDRVDFNWRDGIATQSRYSPCGGDRSETSARRCLLRRRRQLIGSRIGE